MSLSNNGKSGVAKVIMAFLMAPAVLAAGVMGYGVANFYVPGNLPATVGSGILVALITIVAMLLSMRRRDNDSQQGDAGKLSLVDEVGSKQGHSPTPAAGNTRQVPASRPEPKQLMEKLVTDTGESKVSYTTERLSDGSVKIIVTAQGLSGRQFKGANGLRDRVDHIKGAKFTADNNPTEKKRTLTATVKPGPQQATVLTALAKLLGKPTSAK